MGHGMPRRVIRVMAPAITCQDGPLPMAVTTRGTKINSSHPPLTAVSTAYPAPPLLPDKSPAAEDYVIVR
jgi:hypothetical protein